MNCSQQYINGSKGEPLRGLIQDHIISAFLLTKLDTFLEYDVFSNLLQLSLTRLLENKQITRIKIPNPAIYFPRKL